MTKKAQTSLKSPPMASKGGSTEPLKGYQTPRVHTPLNDLPSKGQEMIDFCEKIGFPLLEWQKYLAINAHKVKPDGRWATPQVGFICARQQGKSTFMALRIITGLYLWGEKLQVSTAHKLTTSSEIFFKIFEIIENSPELKAEFGKKIESKGSQELKLLNGNRYLIRANNASGRGIAAVDTIYMDEVREYKDEEVWASMRYTQMSAPNPQIWLLSSAGDQHSIILNKFRDRALACIAGAEDNLAWFEWSGIPDTPIDPDNPLFWESIKHSNPSLGYTIHEDNIRSVLNDEESIVRTEILTNWVNVISPVINPQLWSQCVDESQVLDPEKETWLAIDLSPDRRAAALVAGQRLEEGKFLVQLLNTWDNKVALDDKALAYDVTQWVEKFQTQVVAYSARTANAVAARLIPAGVPMTAVDGLDYAQSCDEFLGAIPNRLVHTGQQEFTRQVLSAVKLPFGDGGWIMGRKVSAANISAAVAASMVTHFATQVDDGLDIVIG